MQRCFYILLLILILPCGFALLFNHDNTNESQNSRLNILQHRHSSDGIRAAHRNTSGGILSTHQNASSGIITPTTKTAAKAVACKTIGKGVCLGVAGIKYAESKLTESNTSMKATSQ